MDWIDETIAIGSWFDAHCVRILRKEKIDLIIDSRALFTKPTNFRNEPSSERVIRAAETMVELSKLKVKVLVFCRHGKDRSPFLAMIYYSKKYGMSIDEAYQLIRSKRPRTVYHPEWVEMLGLSKPR
jgi:ribosomal protein S24E